MRSIQIHARPVLGVLFLGVLFLVSCAPPAAATLPPTTPPPTAAPTQPPPTSTPATTPRPAPGGETAEPTTTGPQIFLPGTPIPGGKMAVSGTAALDFAQAVIEEGKPGTITLNLVGYLPTPCHKLKVEMDPPTPEGQINVRVLALADPNEICIQIIEPFETSVSLDAPASGTYSVLVNKMDAGQVTIQ